MNTQTQEALKMAGYDLDGVITDVEKFDGFDDVCLQTIKRVRSTIAKALEQPAQLDVDLELKQFSKNLIDNQIQDEHPLSSQQLWDLYETEQPAQEPVVWLSTNSKANEVIKTHQWQGLTDDEITGILKKENIYQASYLEFARAIEQALKEKNNG